MNDEKLSGADAAAVAAAEPVASDQLSHVAPMHTTGPWQARITGCDTPSGAALGTITYIESGDVEIAVMYDDTDQIANAHLIAAAPELLEVARMVDRASMCGTKSDPPESWIGWQWSGGGTQAAYRIKELARAAIAKAEGRHP